MKVKFLIAEEIRPEGNETGKLTILGLFPNDNILLLDSGHQENVATEENTGIEKLFILINVSGLPEKKCQFGAKIVDPCGDLYRPYIDFGEKQETVDKSHTFIIKIQPFVIRKFGTYECIFNVNRKSFKFPFGVNNKINTEQNISS